jgi:uncharacterized protein (TIGR03083 family)
MNVTHAAVWNAVHRERAALARDLAALTADQWRAPTACTGWDVHDVVAHLVDTAKTTRWAFIRGMVAARLDFHRQNALGITRERHDDPQDTLAELRSVVARTSTPPAPIATRLVEAFVHGEDIRRAVGLRGDYPVEQVAQALQLQLRTTVKMGGGKERATGLQLIASDAPVDSGTGPRVCGTALALLLAVSGRPPEPDEITGPGAPTLCDRTAS